LKQAPELTLLSDLSGILPPNFSLDFEVLAFQLAQNGPSAPTADGAVGSICILLDNAHASYHSTHRCQVMELRAGYHLLRAFLVYTTGECVKESSAYVEGEFFVGAASVQVERHFLFGQPSICHLSPLPPSMTGRSIPAPGGQTLPQPRVLDFFVHNCELAPANGYQVAVYIENELVMHLRQWAAYKIESSSTVPREVSVRLVLVNPSGEELKFPAYNVQERRVML
jgi:hypothetical protein